MHLKNWSLVEKGPLIELAPAYDLLNTKLLINDEDESALALADRKSGLNRQLLVDYFGRDVCGVNAKMIEKTLHQLKKADWNRTIPGSHLPVEIALQYDALVMDRLELLLG